MNIIKSFSVLVVGSLISTGVLAQNAKPQALDTEIKPAVNKMPEPGARVVATEPTNVAKPTPISQMKPLLVNDVVVEETSLVAPSPYTKDKAEAKPIPLENVLVPVDANEIQPQMPNKTTRPKTIDQATGATESKLSKPKAIPAPVKEN